MASLQEVVQHQYYEQCIRSQMETQVLTHSLLEHIQSLGTTISDPFNTYQTSLAIMNMSKKLMEVSTLYARYSIHFVNSVVNDGNIGVPMEYQHVFAFSSPSSPTSVINVDVATHLELNHSAIRTIAESRLQEPISDALQPGEQILHEQVDDDDNNDYNDDISVSSTYSTSIYEEEDEDNDDNEERTYFRQLYDRKVRPQLQYKSLAKKSDDTQDDCPICFDSFPQSALLKMNCQHMMCFNCCVSHLYSSVTNKSQDATYNCPCCRGPITTIQLRYRKQRGVTLQTIKAGDMSQELSLYCRQY